MQLRSRAFYALLAVAASVTLALAFACRPASSPVCTEWLVQRVSPTAVSHTCVTWR